MLSRSLAKSANPKAKIALVGPVEDSKYFITINTRMEALVESSNV